MANRVALVTGGRRGIGRAIVSGLARAGFDVAFTATRADATADEVVVAVEAAGRRGVCIAGNVAEVADHARVVDAVETALGAIDVFVSNAGVAPRLRLDLLETTPENFDEVLAVNLRGAFFMAQSVARRMAARRRGTLIFVTSCSATMVSTNRIEYCISKAGLSMAVAGLAARLAAEGVGVFEIRPGIIRTDMTSAVTAKYDKVIAEGLVPARRWGEGEDIAAAVRALARGDLGFATGSVLNLDGGLAISRL